jgi:hypothetical protein
VTRYAVRISRFEDQSAFRRVLDLLGRLYPDRAGSDLESGLAKLPCLVSHDAEASVAQALRKTLEARGARVRLLPVTEVDPPTPADGSSVRRTMTLSPEIDLDFLRRAADQRSSDGVTLRPSASVGSARALPTQESAEASGEWGPDKAPWEK